MNKPTQECWLSRSNVSKILNTNSTNKYRMGPRQVGSDEMKFPSHPNAVRGYTIKVRLERRVTLDN